MNQPVTNEACENRRCEIRTMVKEEVSRVMGTVTMNHATTSDWLVRVENKIDDSNEKMGDKLDGLRNWMVAMIIAIALGAIGLRMGVI